MEATKVEAGPLPVVFDASERCDRCGAQAHSKLLTKPVLLFCVHHRIRYGPAMELTPFEIVDDHEVIERLINR